jgi:hypothetical protein
LMSSPMVRVRLHCQPSQPAQPVAANRLPITRGWSSAALLHSAEQKTHSACQQACNSVFARTSHPELGMTHCGSSYVQPKLGACAATRPNMHARAGQQDKPHQLGRRLCLSSGGLHLSLVSAGGAFGTTILSTPPTQTPCHTVSPP